MDASTQSTFGEFLRSHRNSLDLTQEELAARAGLTPQAIGLLERGERRRPHRYTAEKLAEALGLTREDLTRFQAAARRSPGRRATAGPAHHSPKEGRQLASGAVLDTLASLVDNSLLIPLSGSATVQDEDEEPRFTMLEMIREYVLERVESSGEAEEVQRRHAQYYLTLAEATQPQISVAWDEAKWWSRFTRIEREHDNLRAVMGWAVENREVETGARLAIAQWWFCLLPASGQAACSC